MDQFRDLDLMLVLFLSKVDIVQTKAVCSAREMSSGQSGRVSNKFTPIVERTGSK